MRTFTESLKITNNLALLKETFVCMSERGINPNKFVEWYSTEGIEDDSNKSAEKWLSNELLLVEGHIRNWMNRNITPVAKRIGGKLGYDAGNLAAGAVDTGGGAYDVASAGLQSFVPGAKQGWQSIMGQPEQHPKYGQQTNGIFNQPQQNQSASQQPQSPHVKSAIEALDALSKRLNKSENLRNKLGDKTFQSMVLSLKKILQDNQHLAPEPQEKPNVMQFPKQHSNPVAQAESQDYRFFHHINKVKKERKFAEIRQGLIELESYGIGPEAFVEWDAWKNRGQGLNHVWNNWGNAGKERQANVDGERDSNAVNNAIKAIEELEGDESQPSVSGDFLQLLNNVKQKLVSLNAQPEPEQQQAPTQAPEPEPKQPEQQQAPTQAPEPEQAPTQAPEPEQAPTQAPEPEQKQAPSMPGAVYNDHPPAMSWDFWEKPDSKPQRDQLLHQIANMNFASNDGSSLDLKNSPRPSTVVYQILKSDKAEDYKDDSGQSLKDFLWQWKPQDHAESNVHKMPSFYEYMARRSL